MKSSILPVRSLLVAIFMLMAGSGFLATLTGLRLERASSGTLAIGTVATAYFVGLTIGALRAGPVVHRVGHIRAFAAFVSLLSASTLAYALFQHPIFWGGLRFIDGLCVAGVFICLESWLNERAEPETRGSILAAYMIALYSGQAIGQFLLNVGDSMPSIPFAVASILISLAVIPVVLTRMAAPAATEIAQCSLHRLFSVSPLGTVGVTITGLMLGAFYGLAAVHVRRLGLDLTQTSMFMGVVILGGVALQWPLGRMSDRFDRRRVIVFSFIAATIASAGISGVATAGTPLLALGAVFGGLSFALYPLCVAHTNDRLDPDERVAASGRLVLLYSVGAALGPIGAAVAMTVVGSGGLFIFIALCAGAMSVFGLWRQASSDPVPTGEQQDYQILPRTTALAARLDPNLPENAPSPSQESHRSLAGQSDA